MTALPVLEATSLPDDAVEIGRIADAWGVKGWFKVLAFSAEPAALLAARRWYLQPTERGARAFEGTVLLELRQSREHSGSIVAWAHGIDDRNGAEALRGSRIFIPRSAFPKAADDEFYWVDLIGLTVRNREEMVLGVVRDLLTTGPQTVLVLEGEAAAADDAGAVAKPVERMIPFVSAFVDQVDVAGGFILVDWQPDF